MNKVMYGWGFLTGCISSGSELMPGLVSGREGALSAVWALPGYYSTSGTSSPGSLVSGGKLSTPPKVHNFASPSPAGRPWHQTLQQLVPTACFPLPAPFLQSTATRHIAERRAEKVKIPTSSELTAPARSLPQEKEWRAGTPAQMRVEPSGREPRWAQKTKPKWTHQNVWKMGQPHLGLPSRALQ